MRYNARPMRLHLPAVVTTADYDRVFHDPVWQEAARLICGRHNLSSYPARRSAAGEHILFFVEDRFVIKIFAPFRHGFNREKAALEFARGRIGLPVPEVAHAGELDGWPYLVMTQLAGRPATAVWPAIEETNRRAIVSELGTALSRLHRAPAPVSMPGPGGNWDGFVERQAAASVERQRACGASPEWLERLPAYVAERLPLARAASAPVLLHGDVHAGNLLLVREGDRWRISGVFDFADALSGQREYDFVAPGVLMMPGQRDLQRALLSAYGYEDRQLDATLRATLMLLTVLYECSNLRKYAQRLHADAVDLTLDELERAIWAFAGHD